MTAVNGFIVGTNGSLQRHNRGDSFLCEGQGHDINERSQDRNSERIVAGSCWRQCKRFGVFVAPKYPMMQLKQKSNEENSGERTTLEVFVLIPSHGEKNKPKKLGR